MSKSKKILKSYQNNQIQSTVAKKSDKTKWVLLSVLIAFLVVAFPDELAKLLRAVSDSTGPALETHREEPFQDHNIPQPEYTEEMKNYKPTYQKALDVKKVYFDGRRIAPLEMIPQRQPSEKHSVKVYLMDDFLSSEECDALRGVHDKHIKQWSSQPPLMCFESLNTLHAHLEAAGNRNLQVTERDFTPGTTCLNESLSLEIGDALHKNWSYSTAFYPGESVFSNKVADLIEEATGLKKTNGGKFQITSYPLNIGYKRHTDCTENNSDKRDRMGTILIYLETVKDGGETTFPELGISVSPRKGRALIWNNMNSNGDCDLTSAHQANKVTSGHKYILQRWYYYESFWSLGKRPRPPPLPERSEGQAMVSCDEYANGSCRWYDEWSHDSLTHYKANKGKLKV